MDLPVENKRLKKVIEHTSNGNVLQFSNEIGISQPRVSRLFTIDKRNGRYPLVSFEIIQSTINKFININSEWLLTGKGSMLKADKELIPIHKGKTDREVESQEVPLYDLITTLGVSEIFAESNLTVPLDYIRIPNLPHCDGALYARGDSMYPLLKSGDILLYKIVNDKSNIIWGEMYMCHIICNGDEFFFTKFIKKSEKEGFATFISQNQHHQPIEFPIDCIQSLALVKATIRINSQI